MVIIKMEFLLDSVVLIDHFNRVSEATRFLQENGRQSSISVITRAEVLTGFGPDERPIATKFIDHFPLLEINREVSDLAAELRYEKRWKLPDAFQAALARFHDLKLVTRNTKDFPSGKYEFVINPYP